MTNLSAPRAVLLVKNKIACNTVLEMRTKSEELCTRNDCINQNEV